MVSQEVVCDTIRKNVEDIEWMLSLLDSGSIDAITYHHHAGRLVKFLCDHGAYKHLTANDKTRVRWVVRRHDHLANRQAAASH